MLGTVVSFNGSTRTGVLEGEGGLRYFFSGLSLTCGVRIGDEFSFNSIVDGSRRAAVALRLNLRREPTREAVQAVGCELPRARY
jgi:hypothetical protein